MDSELMHSVVGSYLKPPEKVCVPSFTQHETAKNYCHVNVDISPPKALHGPNSQALILALRTLQDKIRRLELERTQAEDNLNILTREAAEYKKALENETNERNLAHQELIKQKKDISIQLSSAQSRCTLLERQLEYTKRMVLNAEREKTIILEQQAQLQKEKEQDHMKLHAKLEKLDVLEKECFRLTATQKTAEDKIKLLEEKLKEEEHHRKLFQDKACELQTGVEINRILMSSVSNLTHLRKKKKYSKKTKCLKSELPQQSYSKFGAPSFMSGKMMQNCDLHTFLKHAKATDPRCLQKHSKIPQSRAAPPDPEKFIPIYDNLSELLTAMQDELDQMNMEHQELLNQMKETQSPSVCEDIGNELEHLVKKMEIKREQISKLKKHQDSVHKLQQKLQNPKMSEASAILQEDSNSKGSKNLKNSPGKRSHETSSLQKTSHFHPKRVHNLQMKLRKDDIMWEQ
ncbi:PREDICTED: centrosomal protein CEP57L1 [Elephantulus edwardii]|uniref:centrosomal protein CEP57L1 n=1 Tax=Elephantulus edwardii TaxID=28737 RepID=UPI0003F081E8|nr:PREDICTED: centrosomal protein CEP57L1 [Elephantulus edwardii]